MSSNNAVELKGGLYTFMSLRLRTDDLDAIDAALADKVLQAPAFFKDTPVVVDLGELDEGSTTFDGAALLACIRRHRLDPIAASVGNKSSPLAESIALPLMEGNARRTERQLPEGGAVARPSGEPGSALAGGNDTKDDGNEQGQARNDGEKDTTPSPARTTPVLPDGALASSGEIEYVVRTPLLVDRPVRSGQQIYARDTDLIIMGQVGPGAEVIADANIHVYGPLRGRALCGVSGNADARIFCQSLEAELVSVAGNYRMLETIPEDLRGRPAQIWLDDDRLNIEPL